MEQVNSPGAKGILNRTPKTDSTSQTAQVPLDTTANGVVSVPLLRDKGDGKQLGDKFAVTLTADFTATDGSIVFRKGTVVIAKASTVRKTNRTVQATTFAMVYSDRNGQIKQQPIPEGAMVDQLSPSQTAGVTIKPNGERNGSDSPKTIFRQQKTNSAFPTPTSTFNLHDFLISPNCQAFILDRSGRLVARNEVTEPKPSISVDGLQRESTQALQQKVIQLSTEYLLKHYGSLAAINSSQNLNFTASNSLYLLQVRHE